MKIIVNIICFSVFLLALVCCTDNHEDDGISMLKVTESNVMFDANGGTGFIKLESSVPFTVTCRDSWCKATVSNNNLIEVTVASSQESESRTALVVISTSDDYINVPVTQEGCAFTIEKRVVGFDNQAGTKSVRINTGQPVSAKTEGDWVTAFLNGDKLNITVKENTEKKLRSSHVILECENYKDTILVNQGEIGNLLGKYQLTGTDIAKMSQTDSSEIVIDWINLTVTGKLVEYQPYVVEFKKTVNSYSLIVQNLYIFPDEMSLPTKPLYWEWDIPIIVNEEDLSFTIVSGNHIGIFDQSSINSSAQKYSMFTAIGIFQQSWNLTSSHSMTFQFQNLGGKTQALYQSNRDINGKNPDTFYFMAAIPATITNLADAKQGGWWGYVHEPRFVKME
ncbi:MAG: BACON domain-containing protein [Prevotella sp.]|nr:BACON domain-containing protein [Prevotella sp.]MBP3827778.1 BACON domain-containing protein [Prevotella sp.]